MEEKYSAGYFSSMPSGLTVLMVRILEILDRMSISLLEMDLLFRVLVLVVM